MMMMMMRLMKTIRSGHLHHDPSLLSSSLLQTLLLRSLILGRVILSFCPPPAVLRTGAARAASGSAYAEFGSTKVIVSV